MKVVNNRKNGVCAFANVFNKYRCELDNVKCDSDELNTNCANTEQKKRDKKSDGIHWQKKNLFYIDMHEKAKCT